MYSNVAYVISLFKSLSCIYSQIMILDHLFLTGTTLQIKQGCQCGRVEKSNLDCSKFTPHLHKLILERTVQI